MNETHTQRARGFVREPPGRGTLTLVWSSLVTVFLCAWTVQRLNITEAPSSDFKILRRKLFWMLITLLAPEYTAMIAFDQWRCARDVAPFHRRGLHWWKPLHGFYADMGGIHVKLNMDPRFRVSKTGTIVEMKDGTHYVLRSRDLLRMLEEKVLDLPEITEESIYDRSKADIFAKIITGLQALWFTIEKLARLAKHLPLSLLEITTLAFIACSVVLTFFWWNKPLDIQTPTVLSISAEKEASFIRVYPDLVFEVNEQDLAEKLTLKDFWYDLNKRQKYSAKHALWIGTIFNAIHIAGWNADFPTPTERLMWRICSICASGSLVAFCVALFLPNEDLRLAIAYGLLAPVYCVCRLFLVVESLIELRSLPIKVYSEIPWEEFIPHIS